MATRPEDPTSGSPDPDYVFDGWYADEACETPWDFSTVLDDAHVPNGQSITLYGQWVPPAYYDVTFNTRGIWTTPPVQRVIEGRKATAPALEAVDGKALLGWYLDEDCTIPWDFTVDTVTTDTALYASWTSIYNVTFDANGHGVNVVQKVTCGQFATEPDAPTAAGFIFNGWYVDAACTTSYAFGIYAITEDVTLYAKWVSDGSGSGSGGSGGGGGGAAGGAAGGSGTIAAEGILIAIGEGMNLGDVAIEALDDAIAAGTAKVGETLEQAILDCLAGEGIASAYLITAAEEVDGKLIVTLPAKGVEDGDVVTVIFTEDGTTKAVNAPVSGGGVSVETTELGLFVVMEEERNVVFFELDGAVKKDGAYVPMAADRYKDVSPDNWFYEGIGFMNAFGVINGMGGDRFEPTIGVTLAQLSTMIMRFAGEETIWSSGIGATGRNAGTQAGAIAEANGFGLADGAVGIFDIYNAGADGHWYDAAMSWVEANGMVGEENSLAADDSLIRAKVVLMIYNLAKSLGWADDNSELADLSGYLDGAGMTNGELHAMQWAVAEGIVSGRTERYLAAGDTVTRAEVAIILTRLLKKYDEKVLFLPQGNMNNSAE
jgi:uncharacterized repeat protein (TIGR02543 family)